MEWLTLQVLLKRTFTDPVFWYLLDYWLFGNLTNRKCIAANPSLASLTKIVKEGCTIFTVQNGKSCVNKIVSIWGMIKRNSFMTGENDKVQWYMCLYISSNWIENLSPTLVCLTTVGLILKLEFGSPLLDTSTILLWIPVALWRR